MLWLGSLLHHSSSACRKIAQLYLFLVVSGTQLVYICRTTLFPPPHLSLFFLFHSFPFSLSLSLSHSLSLSPSFFFFRSTNAPHTHSRGIRIHLEFVLAVIYFCFFHSLDLHALTFYNKFALHVIIIYMKSWFLLPSIDITIHSELLKKWANSTLPRPCKVKHASKHISKKVNMNANEERFFSYMFIQPSPKDASTQGGV